MSCVTCHKGDRARWYCRRPDCPKLGVSAIGNAPAHERYNTLVEQSGIFINFAEQVADTCYVLMQTEDFGPAHRLEEIARAASDFASAMRKAKRL